MSFRTFAVCAAILTVSVLTANPSWAQGKERYGVWINSTNPNNVMTYTPYEGNGMKITISNPSKPGEGWDYVTLFDGKYRPVHGLKGAETAVEVINAKSTRILNKRNGVLYQVVINTLNADNTKIDNYYVRLDKDGQITSVMHITYDRKK
ncbi:MAG: hypothetical protein KGN76_04770 [Acidobacteriota bacterium]|nr:hypothetical protein [Acidobacteriota bacterium]